MSTGRPIEGAQALCVWDAFGGYSCRRPGGAGGADGLFSAGGREHFEGGPPGAASIPTPGAGAGANTGAGPEPFSLGKKLWGGVRGGDSGSGAAAAAKEGFCGCAAAGGVM